ncbi:hypothetical protein CAPTEDRAFT_200528 [Capitella teleta]|uniref:G-protein coupled receptors family 1 profile domain-containing protein n=1 Tax=Capitella teleta TaxID=283909 RepID=R7U260_CAPTE|nr:hypothetical protein CAPTEDRAFT_200528 [Capitella teleta]|eukprot:ELT99962.1 hypothetical protein CAPTEDRAFT_200528 [Capitella teleta]
MEATTAVTDVPVEDNFAFHVTLQIGFCVFCTLGILSNLLLLMSYAKHPELESPTTLLLVSQSIADLITCALGMFYIFLSHFEVGRQLTSRFKYLCLITLCLVTLTVWASLFTLLSLSLDRMVNIRFPFHYTRLVSEPLVKRFIVALWVVMIGIISFPLFGMNTWKPDQVCSAFTVFPKAYFVHFLLLASLIVIILVGALNLVICAVAISKRKVHPSGNEVQQSQSKSQYKLTKMLLVVVGVFYACWMPYTILNMIVLLGTKTLLGGAIPGWFIMLLESSKLLLSINAFLNPLIYAWKVREFRKAFWKTIGRPT